MKAGDIEAGIVILEEPFTVRDVADKVGGSPLTIKAALDRPGGPGPDYARR